MAMVVSWFSAGASSAVATKLAIDDIDKIIYTHIADQHHDTLRFVEECEEWFGKPIEILQSPAGSVETVIMLTRYINGPKGAPCTRILKREVRKQWEQDHINDGPFTYVWGLDADEEARADRIVDAMPMHEHWFPLIEHNHNKDHVHRILRASGIKRPEMYELGYNNNNCVGCVKGGMGYWNKIRVDFPEVFKSRAKLERKVGASCINGVYLDELDPDRGLTTKPIVDDCGIFCELLTLEDNSDED